MLRPLIPVLAALALVVPVGPAALAGTAQLFGPSTTWEPTKPAQTSEVVLKASNNEVADVLVLSVSIGGPDAADLSVAGLRSFVIRDTTQEADLAALTFAPSSVGWKEATATVVYDTDASDEVVETDSIDIPVRVLATDHPEGIAFLEESVDLGTVKRRVWATSSATVKNVTEIPITIADVGGTLSLAKFEPYGETCEGVVLDPGETCTVHIRASSDDARAHEGWLHVGADEPFGSIRLRLDLTVIEDLTLPDNEDPVVDEVSIGRVVGVRFGTSNPIVFRVTWSGQDDRGVAGYRVELRSSSTGAVLQVPLDQQPPWPDPLAPITQIDMAIDTGKHFVRVKARDTQGNEGTARSERTDGANALDLTGSPATRTGAWLRVTGQTGYMGRDLLRTRTPGSRTKVPVDGDRLYVVVRRSPKSGVLRVASDGVRLADIDLRRATASGPVVVGPFELPAGALEPHRVVLTAIQVGTRTLVEVDALIRVRCWQPDCLETAGR